MLGTFRGDFCIYCFNARRPEQAVDLAGIFVSSHRETFLRYQPHFYFTFYLNITYGDSTGLLGYWEIFDGDDIYPSLGVFCASREPAAT
jgi:hypothetical protein